MIEIKNLTLENLDDVFTICAGGADAYNIPEDEFVLKGREMRIKWLRNMFKEYGSCTKVAYLDGRPVAQILYYPEKAMKYLKDRRKNVIHIQCIVNPFPEAQGLGIGTALMQSLVDDCKQGLEVLDGDKCSFLVSYPYATVVGISLSEFYSKLGFKFGQDEFYYEITSNYYPRKKSKYIPVPEDKNKVIIFYNPTCEYGYWALNQTKKILQNNFEKLPIQQFNIWEDYKEYLKRPQQPVVLGRGIVNQQTVDDFLFWTDVDKWLDEVRSKLLHGL